MSYRPIGHLTRLIEAWLIQNGAEPRVTRSALQIADVINITLDSRIVVYDSGYLGKAYLSNGEAVVLSRVVAITDSPIMSALAGAHGTSRVKWVHPYDPDFFSALAGHLRLGSFSKVESYKRLAYESSSV